MQYVSKFKVMTEIQAVSGEQTLNDFLSKHKIS